MAKLNTRKGSLLIFTSLIVCEKNHQFLSSIKKDAHKRKLVLFLPHSVVVNGSFTRHRVHGNAASIDILSISHEASMSGFAGKSQSRLTRKTYKKTQHHSLLD